MADCVVVCAALRVDDAEAEPVWLGVRVPLGDFDVLCVGVLVSVAVRDVDGVPVVEPVAAADPLSDVLGVPEELAVGAAEGL